MVAQGKPSHCWPQALWATPMSALLGSLLRVFGDFAMARWKLRGIQERAEWLELETPLCLQLVDGRLLAKGEGTSGPVWPRVPSEVRLWDERLYASGEEHRLWN